MLVTGAGGGIGLVTARELARVVLGVRNPEKARYAIAGLPGTSTSRGWMCPT